MADYKIVDSGKLDTDLTVLADAIRQRSGTDGKLAFPSGMADAVKNIPSEGLNLPELADPAAPGDMANGKSLFDHHGNMITGTVPVWNGLDFGRYICQEDGVQCGLGTDEDWIVLTTPPLEKRFMLESGAVATASRPLSDLGNASPEDVVAGKTFTSAAGLNASGTVKEVSTVYNTPFQKATMVWDDDWKASNILEEDVLLRKGTAVNTWFEQYFFGDAQPADVAMGKTFTSASGIKVEGNVVERSPETGDLFKSVDYTDWEGEPDYEDGGYCLHRIMSFLEDAIVRKGAKVHNYVWGNDLGDARPEDVRAGKTFTSGESGKLATGTMEPGTGGSGSAPSQITITTDIANAAEFKPYWNAIGETGTCWYVREDWRDILVKRTTAGVGMVLFADGTLVMALRMYNGSQNIPNLNGGTNVATIIPAGSVFTRVEIPV